MDDLPSARGGLASKRENAAEAKRHVSGGRSRGWKRRARLSTLPAAVADYGMAKVKVPVTPALRFLRASGADFETHLYDYVERGGAAASAAALGVDLHAVVKTLVLENETGAPCLALMHGDREVSTKALARHAGCKTFAPCEPAVADRHSGYRVGGTSPFATRAAMPVYIQATVLDLPRIFVNGGKRGFLVSMDPRVVADLLSAEAVEMRA
jgi:Cys-tRNA(Pro) deacylase